jgi:hypothetical protein
MDPLHSQQDPALVTVKITVPGIDGESAIRKFKLNIAQIQKDVIHKSVIYLYTAAS